MKKRRYTITVYACGAPLFVALLHLNLVSMFGPRIKRSLPWGMHPSTSFFYDRPYLGAVILVLTSLTSAAILYAAWKHSKDPLRASKLETNACLVTGTAILMWIFGMLLITMRSFLLPAHWEVAPGVSP